jgi:cytoskeleton protein RodZ
VSRLGARLKNARESRGLSLHGVSDMTKISIPLLEALERDEYGRLPGGIFSKSFVKAYAVAVGLDADSAVAQFIEEHAQHERDNQATIGDPQVTPEDREFLHRQQRAVRLLRGAAVVVAAVAVAALFYELWVWWPRSEPEVATVPHTTPAPSPSPPPASNQPDPSAAKPAVEAPPPPAAPKPEPPRKPMVFEFAATAPCLLELIADGVLVFSRELQAGERQRVEATKELRVNAGDAGALEWTINGARAAALGEAGKSAQATVTPETRRKYLPRAPLF